MGRAHRVVEKRFRPARRPSCVAVAQILPGHTYGALKVAGDSMVDVFIPNGSTVIYDHNITPESGDIAIADVRNQRVIKIYYNGHQITLIPASRKFDPSTFHRDEVRIVGVVVQVIHYLRRPNAL